MEKIRDTAPGDIKNSGKSENYHGKCYKDCETCVCCHRDVPVIQNTHICERQYYIEGAGQLCQACYMELYGRKC